MTPSVPLPPPRRRAQRGAAAVEFALVAMVFFVLLIGAMEFGRLFYLWNTVQEVTRNAARMAVVTNFADAGALQAIRRAAVFRATDGPLPAAAEVTQANVVIRYLTAAGAVANPLPVSPGDNIAACIDETRAAECIRFVEVCVSTGATCDAAEAIAFVPMSGLFSGDGPGADLTGLRIPMSTVRMPAESLGFMPDL